MIDDVALRSNRIENRFTFFRLFCLFGGSRSPPPSFPKHSKVRTSKENLEVWDSDGKTDRLLESPDAWNRDMEREAAEYRQGLRIELGPAQR
mmetsp:Transcript_80634/g.216073  ORF Transcript_80634/g.216073 Transcript_80634/m.216073 type:complete len:92 (+) Transcript_80634:1637-1912(+)